MNAAEALDLGRLMYNLESGGDEELDGHVYLGQGKISVYSTSGNKLGHLHHDADGGWYFEGQ